MVGFGTYTVVVGHVGDGSAEVPVEPDARLLIRGTHLDGVDFQGVFGADQVGAVVLVVAVVVPLLVVVACETGAAPCAEGSKSFADLPCRHCAACWGGLVGYQHKIDIALLCDVGDGVDRVARYVDRGWVTVGIEHSGIHGHWDFSAGGIGLVRVALRTVEPPQVTVGQGVLLCHLLGLGRYR